MNGAELARLVDDLIATPDDIKARVKIAIEPRPLDLRAAVGAKTAGGKE